MRLKSLMFLVTACLLAGLASAQFGRRAPDPAGAPPEAEFHMAIRNPATFLPDLRGRALGKGHGDILQDIDPRGLRWSDTIR